MKVAVLGTGNVGRAIGSKLVEIGHQVRMGSRSADNENAAQWVAKAGASASHGTYEDAAAFGEILFNCTSGAGSLAALESAGRENLAGKVLVDIANPLDFSRGMPPTLFVCNDDSLGEQIQRAYPELSVVKTLNTMNCDVMVDPGRVGGTSDVFMSGNDPEAKAQVAQILTEGFGWERVIDLGDISTARGTEAWLLLWIRLWGALGTPNFNLKLVRPE